MMEPHSTLSTAIKYLEMSEYLSIELLYMNMHVFIYVFIMIACYNDKNYTIPHLWH